MISYIQKNQATLEDKCEAKDIAAGLSSKSSMKLAGPKGQFHCQATSCVIPWGLHIFEHSLQQGLPSTAVLADSSQHVNLYKTETFLLILLLDLILFPFPQILICPYLQNISWFGSICFLVTGFIFYSVCLSGFIYLEEWKREKEKRDKEWSVPANGLLLKFPQHRSPEFHQVFPYGQSRCNHLSHHPLPLFIRKVYQKLNSFISSTQSKLSNMGY